MNDSVNTSLGWIMLWVGIFAVSMGFLESAVVVYLRTIFYPEGFSFPLKALTREIGITELLREAATIIMLVIIGVVSAKKFIIRFALFIYAFAIWDIFYYVFLYILIGWPSSLLEWDILFLIPVTWTGPVISPVINSLTMILLAGSIVYAERRTGNAKITVKEWLLLILGSLVTIVAYTLDYVQFMLHDHTTSLVANPSMNYIPQFFNWWLFATGELFFVTAILSFWRRTNRKI
ncbi:MAG: hypothetical protein Q8M08_15300 [Bacteroidales bacterium]|nr:hypothetical protein [Bacteroidales bacterium]